jgi:hypothetical protein
MSGSYSDLASMLLATVQTSLINANTLAGSTVEQSRSDAFTDADPTAIALYIPTISRERIGQAPLQFRTTLQLVIVAVVYRPIAAQAQADIATLRLQIENAVFSSPSILALPMEGIMRADSTIEFPDTASPAQAILRMVIDVQTTDEFDNAINPVGGPTVPNGIGTEFAEADLTIPGPAPDQVLIGADIIIPT